MVGGWRNTSIDTFQCGAQAVSLKVSALSEKHNIPILRDKDCFLLRGGLLVQGLSLIEAWKIFSGSRMGVLGTLPRSALFVDC